MSFSEQQIVALTAKLDPKNVKKPSGQFGPKGDYIEGWHAIAEANRIFGFDAWSYRIVDMNECHPPMQNEKGNHAVSFIARVEVTVSGVSREDVGYGSGFAKQLGDAYESATKEAVTDALKRALKSFGNPFGLALYDKTQANVGTNEARTTDQRSEQGRREVARQNPAPKKAEARPVYSELERDMRLYKSKSDLREWMRRDDVRDKRALLPPDWNDNLTEAIKDYAAGLPEREQSVLEAG